MATKKINLTTDRIPYGYANAKFPDLDSAKRMAKLEYKRMKEKYGDEIVEDFDKALVEEEYSVYLKLTRIVNQ